MPASPDLSSPCAAGALDAAARRRGRRLAVLSHPAGMTHRNVFTDQLPTLALVGLGASEAVVGLQRVFDPLSQGLQLLALRGLGRVRMRTMLVAGQAAAVAGGLPLIAYGVLGGVGGDVAIAIALASLAATAAGLAVANAVWFPLLRGYVEPGRIGAFFGVLRTGWHVALIGYFLAARHWLEAHPGAFGPLFGLATAAGLVRIALLLRLPEPGRGERAPRTHDPEGQALRALPAGSTHGSDRLRARDALGLVRHDARLRRYLAGMILYGGARRAATPFAIVMMRRSLGLSDADVALTTAAFFAGGFASLYGWGRVVDRFGALPVFRATALGTAALLCALALGGGRASVALMVGFFFLLAVLSAGFGVADTHVLFGLAPEHEPTPMLVAADVTTSFAYGAAPFAAGLALDLALGQGAAPAAAYAWLFAAAAVASALAPLPLRGLRR